MAEVLELHAGGAATLLLIIILHFSPWFDAGCLLASMRINITLDVDPSEVPLATELLNTLRCVVGLTDVPAQAAWSPAHQPFTRRATANAHAHAHARTCARMSRHTLQVSLLSACQQPRTRMHARLQADYGAGGPSIRPSRLESIHQAGAEAGAQGPHRAAASCTA